MKLILFACKSDIEFRETVFTMEIKEFLGFTNCAYEDCCRTLFDKFHKQLRI